MSNIDSKTVNNILYLDVGNSSIKGAYKEGVAWKSLAAKKGLTAAELITWINEHPESFNSIVVSSVRKDVREAIHESLATVNLKELTIADIPDALLNYETPETLGIDRFLACFGATEQTTQSVVVIDAGTAITIDYMDEEDVYHGGLIAPGLSSYEAMLSTKAPALPKVDMEIPDTWPGKSTINSLKWGQAGFIKMAIEGILDKYEAEFGTFDLFVTGGDALRIQEIVDRESKVRPFLVFEGMKRMLKSNFPQTY